MVARPLAADADVLALLAAGRDRAARACAFTAGSRSSKSAPAVQARVAVEAERQLGQVVGADREAVEELEELVGQDRVATAPRTS